MPSGSSRNRRRGSGAKGGQTFQEQLNIVGNNLKRAGDAVGDFVEKATPVVVEGWNQFISLDPQVEYDPNRFGGAPTKPDQPGNPPPSPELPPPFPELPSREELDAQELAAREAQPKTDNPPEPEDDKGNTQEGGRTGSTNPNKPELSVKTGVHKAQTGEKFAPAFGKSQLRYPYEHTQSNQDYIRFNLFKYERNGKFFSSGIGDETVALKNLLGSILLPVPSAVNDSNSVQYGSSNLNAFVGSAFQFGEDLTRSTKLSEAGEVVRKGLETAQGLTVGGRNIIRSKLVASAVSQLGANLEFNQVLARSSGEIINPNMELLFNAPTLRQFKFQFKFTPRFEKETLEVKRIIKAFKKNMAAKGGSNGLTLHTPNIFQLQYVKGNGRPQGFLHEFKLCALQTVSVNYTGDGNYSTYYDGTPVSMTMELAFQELSPVYNEDYDLRNNRDGVGF